MTETYGYPQQRHERRDPSLRAADRDRDAVADILREQHLSGRLETDEFQERLDRCYTARTYGELDELVADLPAQHRQRSVSRAWRWRSIALLPLVIAAVALSLGHLLWLVIPLFFFVGRPLLRRSTGGGFGSGFIGCGIDHGTPPRSYV